MADKEEEQPPRASRRRKPAGDAGGTGQAGQQSAEPSAEPEKEGGGDEGEWPIAPSDLVTGSAASGSPAGRSGRAIEEVLAELPPEQRNALIPGTLTVHYDTRDVPFPMDGESAMRMLAVLAGTSNDVDGIDRTSDALRMWMMIDRHQVLGAQWTPGTATVPRRATMDPGGLVDIS